MENAANGPVLLFDGVCNLCNATVQWILLRDKRAIFRFASLQSETGQAYLQRFGLDRQEFNTVVLVDGDRIYTHSSAPLQVVRRLGFPWSMLSALGIVPPFLRDAIYNWIARNRYHWFGRQDQCMLPRPEWRSRFL